MTRAPLRNSDDAGLELHALCSRENTNGSMRRSAAGAPATSNRAAASSSVIASDTSLWAALRAPTHRRQGCS